MFLIFKAEIGLEKAITVILGGKGNATGGDARSLQLTELTVDGVEMIQAHLWSHAKWFPNCANFALGFSENTWSGDRW